MTEKDAEEKNDQESKELINKLMDDLDVDENVASILVQEGFVSIEEVAYVPTNELLAIEEFNEEIVNELRSRARDILVTQALVNEEIIDQSGPSEDLLELDGMDKELAFELASKGVITREDLAEQSVIDLEVIKSLDAQKAAEIIMKARAHWFDDKEEKSSDKEKGNVNE